MEVHKRIQYNLKMQKPFKSLKKVREKYPVLNFFTCSLAPTLSLTCYQNKRWWKRANLFWAKKGEVHL
jgi:hypothetical protein